MSKYDDPMMPTHSVRNVIKGDNSLYVIAISLPVVEEYSFSGELLSSFDLTAIPERATLFRKEQSIVPNTYFVATGDVCYNDGCLFLLSATTIGGYRSNIVIVLEKGEQEWKHTNTYELSGADIYTSIAVSDDGFLLALNYSKASIDKYKLTNDE